MDLVDPQKASQVLTRLLKGKEMNELVEEFQSILEQILNTPEYTSRGVAAKNISVLKLVITTPHGDLVCTSQHALSGSAIVARVAFSELISGADDKVTAREVLSLIITDGSFITRIGDQTVTAQFGKVARDNSIVYDVIVLVLAQLQDTLRKP